MIGSLRLGYFSFDFSKVFITSVQKDDMFTIVCQSGGDVAALVDTLNDGFFSAVFHVVNFRGIISDACVVDKFVHIYQEVGCVCFALFKLGQFLICCLCDIYQ